MKNFTHIIIAGFAFLAAIACVTEGDLQLDPVPNISFDYESDGLTLTFYCTVDGVSNISWSISDGGSGSGETMVHTFDSPATYWVQMTGTYNGETQSVSSQVVVAKSSVISIEDGSFDDWDLVTYEDFQLTGSGSGPIIEGKVDYDGNYIYFYIAFDTTVEENCDASSSIIDFFIDVDGDSSTGYSINDIGCEHMVEGQITVDDPWWGVYGAGDDYSPWSGVDESSDLASGFLPGYWEQVGDICYMEFALSRKTFEMTDTLAAVSFCLMNADWSDVDYLYYDGSPGIYISMDKE